MIRWSCACRASKHCPASVYTDLLPANPVLKADHNHCPEPVKIEVDRCRTEMWIHAAASNDPPARIYAEKITGLTDAAKALLPSVDTCKRTISRNRIQEYPAEPASLLNLNILRPWTHTLVEQQDEFLFFDNGPQAAHRIIAYATENNLRRLAAADKWFMDGNFAMAPTILADLRDPCVSGRGDHTIGVCLSRKQDRRNISRTVHCYTESLCNVWCVT